MKSDFARFVFVLVTATVLAALEELLPKVGGIGVPLLLAWSLFAALRAPLPAALMTAAACGAFEDALGALPPAASTGFFVLAAVAIRRLPAAAAFFAFPLYQLWLWAWMPAASDLALRILTSFPLGAFGLLAAWAGPDRLGRRIFPHG